MHLTGLRAAPHRACQPATRAPLLSPLPLLSLMCPVTHPTPPRHHCPAPLLAESPIAGGQVYGGGEEAPKEPTEFSNVFFGGQGILDSQVNEKKH